MSNDNKQSSIGNFLCAELNAELSALNMCKELQQEIKKRGINSAPVADETVWPKTVNGSKDLPPGRSKWFDRDINLPSSLYGW